MKRNIVFLISILLLIPIILNICCCSKHTEEVKLLYPYDYAYTINSSVVDWNEVEVCSEIDYIDDCS